jgi:hypothetical protein
MYNSIRNKNIIKYINKLEIDLIEAHNLRKKCIQNVNKQTHGDLVVM